MIWVDNNGWFAVSCPFVLGHQLTYLMPLLLVQGSSAIHPLPFIVLSRYQGLILLLMTASSASRRAQGWQSIFKSWHFRCLCQMSLMLFSVGGTEQGAWKCASFWFMLVLKNWKSCLSAVCINPIRFSKWTLLCWRVDDFPPVLGKPTGAWFGMKISWLSNSNTNTSLLTPADGPIFKTIDISVLKGQVSEERI